MQKLLEDLPGNINAGCERAYSMQQWLANAYLAKERKVEVMLNSSANHQTYLFQPQAGPLHGYLCMWDMLLQMAQARDAGSVSPCPPQTLESLQ